MGELHGRLSMEQVILINHPRHEGVAEEYAARLQKRYDIPDLRREESLDGGWEPNIEQLDKLVGDRKGVAVAVFGGDGTYRDIGQGLIRTPELAARVAITSLGGGNGGDGRKSIHGMRGLVSPKKFMEESRAVQAYALETTITAPSDGSVATYNAMSYMGWGKSAEATAKVASKEYQAGTRVIRDIGIILGVLSSKYAFETVHPLEEPDPLTGQPANLELRKLGELTFSKGPRMAKLAKFPIKHWEEAFRVTTVRHSRVAAVVASLELLVGKAPGTNQQDAYHFTPLNPVLMHCDGEPPLEVAAHSRVTVGLAKNSYAVLTSQRSATR